MGNGNRSSGSYIIGGGGGGGVGGEVGESGKSTAAPATECDVGLGLNMQQSKKMTTFMPYPSPYYHHNQYQASAEITSGMSSKPISGKVLFTASQWQELERQTMIYKYIMASIPVPPQLLIQSSRSGMDMRFSNGSDAEPWRCRRTDGKKWRCSRDVAPEQKYCERHAHKTRPRSRKPVESHNTNLISTNALNNTKHNSHPTPPPPPCINNNNLSAATSFQQARSNEWFMRSGTIPVSSSSQQVHQEMHSPRVGSKRDHLFQDFEENHQNQTQFNYNNDIFHNCSLTLSMQSGEDQESFQMEEAPWMGAPPGGPLGEALCLGIASNGPLNVASPHGYSNSSTTSGSCEDGGGRGLRFNR